MKAINGISLIRSHVMNGSLKSRENDYFCDVDLFVV